MFREMFLVTALQKYRENDAAAFALVVHTVQTVWTGLCGLFGVVALPLTNRENKEIPVAVS